MTRFIPVLAGLLLAAPLAATAQPSAPGMHTVGVLTLHREDRAYPVLFEALRQLGYHEDRQSGSHRTLSRAGWADFAFAFHEDEEMGRACWHG
ncbi:MAG TPA: type II toxin-antitoxin system HicA family toxin [Methylomirabilota bacterium]|jgi:hypothetical protein